MPKQKPIGNEYLGERECGGNEGSIVTLMYLFGSSRNGIMNEFVSYSMFQMPQIPLLLKTKSIKILLNNNHIFTHRIIMWFTKFNKDDYF